MICVLLPLIKVVLFLKKGGVKMQRADKIFIQNCAAELKSNAAPSKVYEDIKKYIYPNDYYYSARDKEKAVMLCAQQASKIGTKGKVKSLVLKNGEEGVTEIILIASAMVLCLSYSRELEANMKKAPELFAEEAPRVDFLENVKRLVRELEGDRLRTKEGYDFFTNYVELPALTYQQYRYCTVKNQEEKKVREVADYATNPLSHTVCRVNNKVCFSLELMYRIQTALGGEDVHWGYAKEGYCRDIRFLNKKTGESGVLCTVHTTATLFGTDLNIEPVR